MNNLEDQPVFWEHLSQGGPMPATAADVGMTDFAEGLYDKLIELVGRGGTHQYVAERWLEELLEPLGYERCDQSAVSHSLKALEAAGLIRCYSVRARTGYQAARHRRNYPKPRRREITILR